MNVKTRINRRTNRISVKFHGNGTPAPEGSKIVQTLGYGDEIIVRRMELDTRITGDNFNHIDYWCSTGVRSDGTHTADWKAVSKFQHLGVPEFQYLYSIQPDDFHIWGFTREQKMNWMIGARNGSPPERPYWTRGGQWDESWIAFEFGTMVFGNSRIRVKTHADGALKTTVFRTDYSERDPFDLSKPSEWRIGDIEFVEVDGFKPYMMDVERYPVEWLVENAYIQQATEAMGRPSPNTIGYSPRGNILHPVWDVGSWPSNYGSALYLARFCIAE